MKSKTGKTKVYYDTIGSDLFFADFVNNKLQMRVFFRLSDVPGASVTGWVQWGLPMYVADGMWAWRIDLVVNDDASDVTLDPAGIQGPEDRQPSTIDEVLANAQCALYVLGLKLDA